MGKKFIKQATSKNKGAFRSQVQRDYGADGFTARGTIKKSIVNDYAAGRGPDGRDVTLKTRRRAQLAKNIRR